MLLTLEAFKKLLRRKYYYKLNFRLEIIYLQLIRNSK